MFNVVTTSHDRKGVEYVSMIEGKNLPFYGVQFHPEKSDKLQWIAEFFVAEMQKSHHIGFRPRSVLHLTHDECEITNLVRSCLRISLSP